MRAVRCSMLAILWVGFVIGAWGCGGDEDEGALVEAEQLRDCRVAVFYRSQAALSAAPKIVGSFHQWKPSQGLVMEDAGQGLYRKMLSLPPGRHHYYIEVEGQPQLDAYNPLTMYPRSAQEERSTLYVPDCAKPALELDLQQLATDHVMATVRFKRAKREAPISQVRAYLAQGPEPSAQLTQGVSFDASTGLIQLRVDALPKGKHHVYIEATDELGAQAEPLLWSFWVEDEPFTWEDAIIYQIMIDRFYDPEGPLDAEADISFFHGGQLDGITQKLEEGYFERLGVNTLWLSPVYDNPEGVFVGRDGHQAQAYHGYWPKAPREVESRIGGEQALERLLDTAHQAGVRVIIDTVLNHVHQEHPYANPEDPTRWFNQPDGACICGITCAWNLHMEDCWFDPFMPDLQLRNPVVMDTMLDDALWWLERFDLDGLRLDAVPMMPRPVMRHLRHHVRERIERGGLDVYLLGETFTHKKEQGIIRYFLGPHTLSGQFDFPVMWSLRDALAGRVPMRALGEEVALSDEAWAGAQAVMAPILGNHDVPRFISDMNGDTLYSPRQVQPQRPTQARPYALLKAAWAFILSQPGAPVIYYGDELGMPGANDPDNRRDMRFGEQLTAQEREVLAWVARLTQARRCAVALRRGQRITLEAGLSTYAQLRDAQDGYPALSMLNRSEDAARLTVTLPAATTLAEDATFTAIGAQVISWDAPQLVVELPPQSGALILTDPACQSVEAP